MTTIDILIPAHNEMANIEKTIQSVRSNLEPLKLNQKISYKILVGCNGCTDETATISRSLTEYVFEWPAIGKWQTLKKLVSESSATYICLVDAGAYWLNGVFTTDTLNVLESEDVLGLTYAYSSTNQNFLEKIYWLLESNFKKIEVFFGGLIAVSGITVFYKNETLKSAILFLGSAHPNVQWLNDDVVLPLVLRFQNPKKSIKFIRLAQSNSIIDLGLNKKSSEKNRRHRLMRGNLQWMRLIIPILLNPRTLTLSTLKVLLLASRRYLKVFWGYIGLIIYFAITLIFDFWPIVIATIFLIILLFLRNKIFLSKLIYAFIASLRAPFELIFWRDELKTKWD